MNVQDLIKTDKAIRDIKRKDIDFKYKIIVAYQFIRMAFVLLIIAMVLFSCNSSDDCELKRLDIIEQYKEWIELAREQNDSVQVLLFIEERNKRLDELGC